MIYLQLFWAFFQIGLLSFGGGYAALPLISQQVISTYHWISQNTFTDLMYPCFITCLFLCKI